MCLTDWPKFASGLRSNFMSRPSAPGAGDRGLGADASDLDAEAALAGDVARLQPRPPRRDEDAAAVGPPALRRLPHDHPVQHPTRGRDDEDVAARRA